MNFRYRVHTPRGGIFEANLDAPDVNVASERLRDAGNIVITIREATDVKSEKSAAGMQKSTLKSLRDISAKDLMNRPRSEDFVIFTRQLATMIDAGIPLVRSLESLAGKAGSSRLSGTISGVKRDVETGSSFSEALDVRRETFGRLYVEMVRAGEMGGGLDAVLMRVADQLESDQELRRRVRAAMAYPMFVLVFALVASVFMLIAVVPIFAGMYADLGGELPLATQVALLMSNLLRGPVGVITVIAAISFGYFIRLRIRTDAGRDTWGKLALKLPLGIGGVVRKVAIARSARTLGSLLGAGVPILSALDITASSSGNPVVEQALVRSREAIRSGEEVRTAFEREDIFPPMVTRMVAVGEETGNLDGMLSKVADFYESEVDSAVKALTSMIEPAMVLVVGLVVGGTVVAMYLPMFRIFDLIQ